MNDCSNRVRIISLPEFRDDVRGTLAVATCKHQVPFTVQRVFTIYDMDIGVQRGGHAHRQCQQFVICVAGAVDMVAENADGINYFEIKKPTSALYVPQLTWLNLTTLEAGTIIVVLSSDEFDEADYISDRAEFDTFLKT